MTSVKTNARKEATRIGEKIYFYVCGFDFDTSHQFSVSICQVQVNVIQKTADANAPMLIAPLGCDKKMLG